MTVAGILASSFNLKQNIALRPVDALYPALMKSHPRKSKITAVQALTATLKDRNG